MSNRTSKVTPPARVANLAVSTKALGQALRSARNAVTRNLAQLPQVATPIPVLIRVIRDAPKGTIDLVIEGKELTLTPSTQFVWTCFDGRLEIRLSRKTSPFVGDSYETPLGAFSFSGPPHPKRPKLQVYRFTALVTTPTGDFIAKEFQFKISD